MPRARRKTFHLVQNISVCASTESSRLRELSTDLRLCGSVPALGRFVCFLVMPFRMGGRRKSSITLPAKKGGKLKDMMQKGARRSERPHVNPLDSSQEHKDQNDGKNETEDAGRAVSPPTAVAA